MRVGLDLRPLRLKVREQYRQRRYRQLAMTIDVPEAAPILALRPMSQCILAMQPAMPRHASHQIFHLIGENVAILQNEMFVAIRRVGNIKQFHARLFRCAIGFAVVARAARGDDVDPIVATAF